MTRGLFVGFTLLALLGGCRDDARPRALRTQLPARASCPANDEAASPQAPVEVHVILLCQDDIYGDYGVRETRYVSPSNRSRVELALRELLECCPNRADDLVRVDLVDGVATLVFPSGYENHEDWNNVSTAGGNRAFFPPLAETMFQFSDVDGIASSFGGKGWWPIEADYSVMRRSSGERIPRTPRPIERTSNVAAIKPVARALQAEFGDEDWYERITVVTAGVQNLRIETTLDLVDKGRATDIAFAVDRILSRDPTQWCFVGVDVIAMSGELIDAPAFAPRC